MKSKATNASFSYTGEDFTQVKKMLGILWQDGFARGDLLAAAWNTGWLPEIRQDPEAFKKDTKGIFPLKSKMFAFACLISRKMRQNTDTTRIRLSSPVPPPEPICAGCF
jgi:hypothetical protein